MLAVFSKSSWLVAGILILGLAQSQAQTTATWIGPATGGEWNTGANWDAGSLTFSGSGGTPNGAFTILTTTNLALPKLNWTAVPNGTGTFDGNGTITPPATITVDPTTPLSFYILSQ